MLKIISTACPKQKSSPEDSNTFLALSHWLSFSAWSWKLQSHRKQLSSDNFFNSLSPLHFLPPPFFPLLLLLLILLLLMGVSLPPPSWADLDLFLLVSSFTGLPPANHRLKLIIQVHIPNCPKIWNNEFDLKGSLLHLIKRERVQNSFDYHGGSEVTSFTLKSKSTSLKFQRSWRHFLGWVWQSEEPAKSKKFFFKCFKCSLRNAKCIFSHKFDVLSDCTRLETV